MLITILGRQHKLSLAELESKVGSSAIKFSNEYAALIDTEQIDITKLGGTIKLAKHLLTLENTDLDGAYRHIAENVVSHLQYVPSGKLNFGISVYGFKPNSKYQLKKTLEIKKIIRASGRSVRIIENKKPELSSAQVLYNKLTSELGWELLIIRDGGRILLGQTLAVQDIDEYSRRDYDRPARDAKVGMLPPKLAQIIINLATQGQTKGTVYDPFCGTGVILQEACLMGFQVAGSDIDPRMISYTKTNLDWLKAEVAPEFLETGDATNFVLPPDKTTDFIASEMFLGKPLHSEPNKIQLSDLLRENSELLVRSLENLGKQIESNVGICIAVPAWRQGKRFVSVLDDTRTVDYLKKLGYTFVSFHNVSANDLIYARNDQVVGRKLLVLRRN